MIFCAFNEEEYGEFLLQLILLIQPLGHGLQACTVDLA